MSLGRTLRTLYERRIVMPRLLRRARIACESRGPRRARPGVLIMGWYGLETLGDKAILASILQQIPSDARVIKATYDVDYSRATLRQIGATHVECIGNDLASFAGALPEVDAVIIGGGPLMGSRDMRAWAAPLSLARQVGCRTMVYGCGVGPLDSDETREAVSAVLGQADVITLRDEIAVKNAVSLGVRKERIQLTADPALGIREWEENAPRGEDARLRIGISMRSFPRRCFVATGLDGRIRSHDEMSHALFDAVSRTATRLLDEHEAELHLVPMQTHPSDDDRAMLAKLKTRLNTPDRVHIIEHVESPAAMLNRFASFDFLIGMRFHSIVFGLLTHTPMVAIDYDMHVGKVTGIMQAMGMPDQAVGIGDIESASFAELVMRSVEQRDAIRRRIGAALPVIRDREAGNGEQLRRLLGRGDPILP